MPYTDKQINAAQMAIAYRKGHLSGRDVHASTKKMASSMTMEELENMAKNKHGS